MGPLRTLRASCAPQVCAEPCSPAVQASNAASEMPAGTLIRRRPMGRRDAPFRPAVERERPPDSRRRGPAPGRANPRGRTGRRRIRPGRPWRAARSPGCATTSCSSSASVSVGSERCVAECTPMSMPRPSDARIVRQSAGRCERGQVSCAARCGLAPRSRHRRHADRSATFPPAWRGRCQQSPPGPTRTRRSGRPPPRPGTRWRGRRAREGSARHARTRPRTRRRT